MKYGYYPGCTLKTHAKNFEKTALEAYKLLDIELKELNKWYCCGTVYSLAKDNIIYKISSVRNLIRAQEEGYDKLVVFCSMCYNTLKQAQEFIKDKTMMERMSLFMDDEEKYKGNVEVIHGLELLKNKMDKVKKMVKNPLNKDYAAYYGCTLLRPKKIAIDKYENPEIIEKLIVALGGESIEWPLKNECCGSYNIVSSRNAVAERVYSIIKNARRNGAEAIITSCPLCYFNLDDVQKDIKKMHPEFVEMPIYYFTEIMCMAFDVDSKIDKDSKSIGGLI